VGELDEEPSNDLINPAENPGGDKGGDNVEVLNFEDYMSQEDEQFEPGQDVFDPEMDDGV